MRPVVSYVFVYRNKKESFSLKAIDIVMFSRSRRHECLKIECDITWNNVPRSQSVKISNILRAPIRDIGHSRVYLCLLL